jgi:uncharacterized protein YcfJ
MRKLVMAAAICAVTGAAGAQQPIIYPARGQSPQQQSADMGDCQVWATQTTGVNPAAVAQQLANRPSYSQPQSQTSQPLIGMLGGGAIGGIIHGGEGAAVGALVGGLFGGWRQRHQQEQQQQWNQQQSADQFAQGQLASYNRAYGACMDGRGYVVR